MAVFTVRTMKRVIFEARAYGAFGFWLLLMVVCLFCARVVAAAGGVVQGGWLLEAAGPLIVNLTRSLTYRSAAPQSSPPTQTKAHDAKLTNYLLLGLAAFQFPWAWWMGVAPRGVRV
jgi:hypothetical protein